MTSSANTKGRPKGSHKGPKTAGRKKRGEKMREPEERVVRIHHNPNDNMHLAYDKRNAGAVEELTALLHPRARKCLGLDPFPTMTRGHQGVHDMLTSDAYEIPEAAAA